MSDDNESDPIANPPKYEYGSLNQISHGLDSEMITGINPSDDRAMFEFVRHSIMKTYEPNVFAGMQTFRAIVLTSGEPQEGGDPISDKPSNPEGDTPSKEDFGIIEIGDPIPVFTFRARIPELHASIPDPCDALPSMVSADGLSGDTVAAIQMHPEFIARASLSSPQGAQTTLPVPRIGDIVEVTFEKGPTGGRMMQGIYTRMVRQNNLNGLEHTCQQDLASLFDGNVDVEALGDTGGSNGERKAVTIRTPSLSAGAKESVCAMSKSTGIPAKVLTAIVATESGTGKTTAWRFEAHRYIDLAKGISMSKASNLDAYLANPNDEKYSGLPFTYTPRKGVPGNTRSAVYVDDANANKKSILEAAYKQNPTAAIKSTSWGSGQVMGWALLEAYGGDAKKAWDAFFNASDAESMAISEDLVTRWVEANKGLSTNLPGVTFLDACQANPIESKHFDAIAFRYNGPGQVNTYGPMIEGYYKGQSEDPCA